MARSSVFVLMLAATGLGCGGGETGARANGGAPTEGGGETGARANGGAPTEGGGETGARANGGAPTEGGGAGTKGSLAAAGTLAMCRSSPEDGGATSSDAPDAPLFHRASPACCAAQRGPAPTATESEPYLSECASDSECTDGANGRCFPFEGLVMRAGCSYDECFTDSSCPSRTPCLCRGSAADNTANVCLRGGNCAVDADCGPGGYCSPSPSPPAGHDPGCGYSNYAYYCHTKNDTCVNASDCPGGDGGAGGQSPSGTFAIGEEFPICAYDLALQHWACDRDACLLP